MDYFAGLDISMDETHVCVLDREGVVVHESKTASTAGAIAVELAKASSDRIRDRTHGADPVPRVEPTRPSRGLRRKPAGLTRRSSRWRPIRPIATTREVWRIWPAPGSSSPCM